MRLANLDGTPLGSIKRHQNLELLHRTEWWAWWSDEHLTTAIGLPEALCPEGLSVDAIALMDQVWLGGIILPQCGWALLAKIENVVTRERVCLSSNQELSRCQEKLTLRFLDGAERVLYRCCVEDEGICQCDIVANLPCRNFIV
ncbi:MAG: hypothetical protein AAFV90_25285 [Cyanobacteria bacterium J06634_5]